MTRASGSAVERLPPASAAPLQPLDDFIGLVDQDVREIDLLLDFISGRPDKRLADIDKELLDDQGAEMTCAKIVETYYEIRQQRATGTSLSAQSYAFILKLKDLLNAFASPARGLTIAYTIMFIGGGGDQSPHRLSIARQAFPALKASADRFRKLKAALAIGGILVTVIAAVLLWQALYGQQLAARFDLAKAKDSELAEKIFNELDLAKLTDAEARDLRKVCRIPEDKSVPDTRTTKVKLLCDDYAYKHALLCTAIHDIGDYSDTYFYHAFLLLLPSHEFKPSTCDGAETAGRGSQEDAPTLVGVLVMISNYFLPILFGLAGIITALVRSIQDKVRDSVLSPRDSALALIRLPLGMIAGVCVGLFFNPNAINGALPSSGAFSLSASSIAFLAGYGAESFFKALDALIDRVFAGRSASPSGVVQR